MGGSQPEQSDVENDNNPPDEHEQPKSVRTETTIGIVMLILGGIGLGAGSIIGARQDPISPDTGSPLNLTIFHMNDHHSQVLEQDEKIETVNFTDFPGNLTEIGEEIEFFYGGFPRIKKMINISSEESIAAGNEVLKLHAGDAIIGSLFYSLFKGNSDADLMNDICFDAFAIGNHEFDDGDRRLARFVEALRDSDLCPSVPVLAANLEPAETSDLRVLQESGDIASSIVKTFDNGESVGIIGINIVNKTMEKSRPDAGTIITDEREAATAEVEKLLDEGINKIILLSHAGYENDMEWFTAIDGIDVVVGGDSHSLLGDQGDLFSTIDGPYPTTKIGPNGNKVCIVQAWEYSKGVGKLDVSFDADGNVVSCDGRFLIPFDPIDFDPALTADQAIYVTERIEETFPNLFPVTEDPQSVERLEIWEQQTGELLKQVIADVPATLCLERIPGEGRSKVCSVEESASQGGAVGGLVAKAFLEEAVEADFAVQNAGGCRTDIPIGNFTIDSAYKLLPFSNTLVLLEMNGFEIVEVLEQALHSAFGGDIPYGGTTGAYPYCAGIRFDVRAGAPIGAIALNVEVNPRLKGSWEPINLEATYMVVTNDYISTGKDGYTNFQLVAPSKKSETYLPYAKAFITYAESIGNLIDLPLEEYSTKSFQVLTPAATIPPIP